MTRRPAPRLVTDEPAVLSWQIALAGRPDPLIGRHWWRELVTAAWQAADHAWWLDREAVAIGYATEQREYAETNPRPQLRDFMVHLSAGMDPERALR